MVAISRYWLNTHPSKYWPSTVHAGKICLNLIGLIAIKFNLDFVRWKVVCNSIRRLMELFLSNFIRNLQIEFRFSSIKNSRWHDQLAVQSILIIKRKLIKFVWNNRNQIESIYECWKWSCMDLKFINIESIRKKNFPVFGISSWSMFCQSKSLYEEFRRRKLSTYTGIRTYVLHLPTYLQVVTLTTRPLTMSTCWVYLSKRYYCCQAIRRLWVWIELNQ